MATSQVRYAGMRAITKVSNVACKTQPAARGFATEKQIAMRITSTSNLKKITSSMKMVSAAKMKGDQNRLAAALPFNSMNKSLNEEPQITDEIDVSSWPAKNLIITTSSDKGLCGGVNSYTTRALKKIEGLLAEDGKDFKLIVSGEKGRAQLRRTFAHKIISANTDLSYPVTFSTASAIANEISKVDPEEYDAVHVIYNKFVSAIAYTTTVQTMMSLKGEGLDEPLMAYEFEPDTKNEVLQDLKEYAVASQLFYSMMENYTSEQSSRTQAMENASKNAGELIDALTLQYNKARQSRITTELIEIISGASALEG